jgi:TolB-like protein/class 3 adenylate cyclase/Flp pilus assembly protein TadD
VERRLAAILAADVVGYSRLMGKDEAATLAALKAHRAELIDPKAAQYNGRTIKLMGDGALMEFPSVVEAVAFAVEVQLAMRARNTDLPEDRQIRYRIGINIGDIIVEDDDIYGDGVNIAARLESLAEPGGICVRRNVRNQVRDKLDLDYEDRGEIEVKNIARPIRVFSVVLDDKAEALVTPVLVTPVVAAPIETGHRRRLAIAAVLVLGLVAAGGLAWWQPWAPDVEPASLERMAFPLPEKPSIAVLPFTNMSDDPNQDYFADGMTEDLITDLSKLSGLFVIARNSSFSYKGQQVKVRQVAEELGVRYVLEGSVRLSDDQVRINAQLIDATTGGHLWAERYDGYLTDVFVLQDKVTGSIVAALALNLTEGEARLQSHKETDVPEAYDAFLQGWEYYQRFSADDFVKAISYFEKAVELDPEYGRAYAALASVYWESVRQGDPWTSKVSPDAANFMSFTTSRVNAERYVELAMKNPSPLAHRVASAMSWDYRQFDDAIAEAEQAVALDPNEPDGHIALAWAMIFSGRAQEALAAVERAMRLDPQRPGDYMYVLGMAQIGLDQHQDAVTALQRAHERSPEFLDVNIPLAAAYVHLGRHEEARVALKRYTQVWRTFANNVDGVLGWWPFKREVDVRRFGDGLVQAGLCCAEKLEEYIASVRAGGTLE